MGKRTGDKYINFQVTEPEDKILKSYCELTHRSQTEVLRELVRGLEQKLPEETQELPEGWSLIDGMFTGAFLGHELELERSYCGDSYVLYIDGRRLDQELFFDSIDEAINYAQKLITTISSR